MSYFPIELDKIRNLKYGMRAISRVEKVLKKPISQIDMNNLYMEDMATIVWAGLVQEDPTLTVSKTMGLIDDSNLSVTEVFDIVGNALNKAFSGDEETEEKETEEEAKN